MRKRTRKTTNRTNHQQTNPAARCRDAVSAKGGRNWHQTIVGVGRFPGGVVERFQVGEGRPQRLWRSRRAVFRALWHCHRAPGRRTAEAGAREGDGLERRECRAARENLSAARRARAAGRGCGPVGVARRRTVRPGSRLPPRLPGCHRPPDRPVAGRGVRADCRDCGTFDESVVTWGLEAVLASVSQLSGAGIKVAVLDTGFDDSHPDFLGRLVTKKLFASKSSEGDVQGHGTHCIGTACGPLRPAGVPRYGIAHEAQIFAGKVLGDDGFGTDRSIIAGMDWAVEQGCQVVSMSPWCRDQHRGPAEQRLRADRQGVSGRGRPGGCRRGQRERQTATHLSRRLSSQRLDDHVGRCRRSNLQRRALLVRWDEPESGGGHCRPWSRRAVVDAWRTPRTFQWDQHGHTACCRGGGATLAQSDDKFRGWTLSRPRLLQLVRPSRAPARDVGKGLLQAPRS